jgi:predicted component of type VI protein secretion system
MPFNDPKKHAESVKRYRDRNKDNAVFLESESARKARWYEQNKARKNANQQRARQEQREQMLRELGQQIKDHE